MPTPSGLPRIRTSPAFAELFRFTLSGCTRPDRKSTRLNSSHLGISYAVFCLKKKNIVLHDMYMTYLIAEEQAEGKRRKVAHVYSVTRSFLRPGTFHGCHRNLAVNRITVKQC